MIVGIDNVSPESSIGIGTIGGIRHFLQCPNARL